MGVGPGFGIWHLASGVWARRDDAPGRCVNRQARRPAPSGKGSGFGPANCSTYTLMPLGKGATQIEPPVETLYKQRGMVNVTPDIAGARSASPAVASRLPEGSHGLQSMEPRQPKPPRRVATPEPAAPPAVANPEGCQTVAGGRAPRPPPVNSPKTRAPRRGCQKPAQPITLPIPLPLAIRTQNSGSTNPPPNRRPGKGRSGPGIAGGNHEVMEMDGRRMAHGQLDPGFKAPWPEKRQKCK